MSHLKDYIAEKNRWARIFNQTPMNPDMITTATARRLWESLAADLSPENLTCDGELRGPALRAKATRLRGAVRELEALGFDQPEDVYI